MYQAIIADPKNFDETAYLAYNEDVAAAVERGDFVSGRDHFDLHPNESRVIGYKSSGEDGLTTNLPTPDLVLLVNGHRDVIAHAASRRPAAMDVVRLVAAAGEEFSRFSSVLDFGCGCGRVLAGFEGLFSNHVRLVGCDINPKLVDFAKRSFPFAEIYQTDLMPPLPFGPATFDFIYSSSVFTHMSSVSMRKWAQELSRVMRGGGVLVVSFHGSMYHQEFSKLIPDLSDVMRSDKHYVHQFPDAAEGENSVATLASEQFFAEMFEGFEVLLHRQSAISGPIHFCANQDVLVMRRL
ncbi:class I SAM-dependent methyltransferase [Agrobacterium vitis]|uniref:class I SAM-dependent methyltransferase n=1 Tax=Agrobacterium vitis TaxID=373 RepID=UPI001573C683|nr:class I SAM-dependent methyltransferase [Agrobacterium vitis]NSY21868.1 class I SAM-dependent methyltransferase [Agrobacterium vitis]WEO73156.1 class I SAM-dependent methyltransferase [Agrobacterium vitis]